MKVIIDGFEGDYGCRTTDLTMVDMPISLIPEGAKRRCVGYRNRS